MKHAKRLILAIVSMLPGFAQSAVCTAADQYRPGCPPYDTDINSDCPKRANCEVTKYPLGYKHCEVGYRMEYAGTDTAYGYDAATGRFCFWRNTPYYNVYEITGDYKAYQCVYTNKSDPNCPPCANRATYRYNVPGDLSEVLFKTCWDGLWIDSTPCVTGLPT